jgi:hypothetical protein
MKKKLLILTLIVLPFLGYGHKEDTTKTFSHEIGFHIGSTSGLGPTYRLWYKKIGLQVAFLPVGSFNQSFNYYYYNIFAGLSLNYKLQQNKYSDLYAFLSTSTQFSKDFGYYFGIESYASFPITKSYSTNVGFGLGFDFKFAKVMLLSTQIGYGFYDINDLYRGNIAAGIGLMYKI